MLQAEAALPPLAWTGIETLWINRKTKPAQAFLGDACCLDQLPESEAAVGYCQVGGPGQSAILPAADQFFPLIGIGIFRWGNAVVIQQNARLAW